MPAEKGRISYIDLLPLRIARTLIGSLSVPEEITVSVATLEAAIFAGAFFSVCED
jgi:hypothetical protein